jgi:WD40 repeat protein
LAGHDGYGIKIWQPATSRLLHDLGGNDGTVYLDFSPDGLSLASSHHDGQILIWNAANQREQPRQLLAPDNSGAKWLKFSPDGAMIATYGKGIKLWNVETGALIHALDASPSAYGRGLDFSPDGSLIATNSNNADRLARVWNTQTGALVKSIPGGDGHLAFSPDGSMLVLAFFNVKNSIEFRDTRTWKLLHEITGLQSTTMHVAFNFDGSRLATSHGSNSIRIWDLSWDSILHHAVRGGNLSVVKKVVERFPILIHIRSPQGQSPLELSQELLKLQINDEASKLPQIFDFLKSQINGRI